MNFYPSVFFDVESESEVQKTPIHLECPPRARNIPQIGVKKKFMDIEAGS